MFGSPPFAICAWIIAENTSASVAPGFDADVTLLAAEDWRHLAYHLGGPVVDVVVRAGRVAWRRRA